MYSASGSVDDSITPFEYESQEARFGTFLSLIERARHYSKALTFWEMHSLASLLPNWIHHLSYSQIEEALSSFTKGRFISFLQKGYKEAFGELCRQAYLHGRLYHLLEEVQLDDASCQVIKDEVRQEVLETNKPRFFAKLFGVRSELAVQLDRDDAANNCHVVDTIVADAIVEAACKKMSHPVEDLNSHEEVHLLARRAICDLLAKTAGDATLKVVIPNPRGHGHTQRCCDVNFVYDMASFIICNK